jgi:signal transduction histidine kinase
MQEKVFEPYFQVYREKLNRQGMGMGLSIVNNIVNSLNGEISLTAR